LYKPRNLQHQNALTELSPREAEIFELMGQGYRIRQVANKLGKSYSTIDTYIEKISNKTGVERADLPEYSVRMRTRRVVLEELERHGITTTRRDF